MTKSTRLIRALAVAVLAGGLWPAAARADDSKPAPVPAKPASQSADKNKAAPAPAPPVTRESPYAAAARAARQRTATAETITTDELERRFGAGAPDGLPPEPALSQPSAAAGTGDPIEYLQDLQTAETRQRDAVAKAQAEVDAARLEVAKQQRLLLAATNPLLPRPEMTEDERKAASEGSAAERQARVRGQLEEAQKRLAAAEVRQAQTGR